ncbi:GNAT family N-acetyltransferase [Candidatus Margulisiibacteriota bacterium]
MLKGKLVNLRPVLNEDIPLLVKWFSENPIAVDFLGSNLASIEKVKEYFENAIKKPENRRDFIIETKDGQAIGISSLESINWKHRHAESVNLIGEQGFRTREIIFEAQMRIFDYGFCTLNLHRIYWRILESNPRMINVLKHWIELTKTERVSEVFQLEGILREVYFTHNKYYNIQVYGILKDKYMEFQKLFHKCFNDLASKKLKVLETAS